MRYKYVEKIESYVTQIAACKGKKSDEDEIKRQFEVDVKDELEGLRGDEVPPRYSTRDFQPRVWATWLTGPLARQPAAPKASPSRHSAAPLTPACLLVASWDRDPWLGTSQLAPDREVWTNHQRGARGRGPGAGRVPGGPEVRSRP